MTNHQSDAPTGFIAACKSAGDGWKLSSYTAIFNAIGVAVTIWLPEFTGKILYSSAFTLGRAAEDGRLATLALGNLFILIGLITIIPAPTRRHQYPFLWIFISLSVVATTLAIAASLPRPLPAPQMPDKGLIIGLSWGTAITTTIAAFFVQVAKIGEENILKNWNPRQTSNDQANAYEERVGDI